jgi:hypothetical protein
VPGIRIAWNVDLVVYCVRSSDPVPYAMAASLEVGFGGDGDSGRRQCPLAIFICGSTVRPGTVCGGVQTYAAAISSFLGDPSHP